MSEPTGAPGALAPTRGRLRAEMALVLAVGLGQSAVYSVLRIIERMTRAEPLSKQSSQVVCAVVPDRPALDLAYQIANIVFPLVPAVLAWFLLRVHATPEAGAEAALGLTPRRPLWDAARGGLLFAVIGVPGLAFYVAARAMGINTNVVAACMAEVWWAVPMMVLAAAMNGILEETVMIGYLFARWAQLGSKTWTIIVISAVIRGGYHLYQGFGGFIGNMVMGLFLGWWFSRTRRLAPLIIAHTLLDVFSFVGYTYLAPLVDWL